MDIVVCGNPQMTPWKDPNNAFDNYMRYRDVKSYHSQVNDVFGMMQSYPKVNYRYVVLPTSDLGNAMDFDNSTTWSMQM